MYVCSCQKSVVRAEQTKGGQMRCSREASSNKTKTRRRMPASRSSARGCQAGPRAAVHFPWFGFFQWKGRGEGGVALRLIRQSQTRWNSHSHSRIRTPIHRTHSRSALDATHTHTTVAFKLAIDDRSYLFARSAFYNVRKCDSGLSMMKSQWALSTLGMIARGNARTLMKYQ